MAVTVFEASLTMHMHILRCMHAEANGVAGKHLPLQSCQAIVCNLQCCSICFTVLSVSEMSCVLLPEAVCMGW